MVSEAPRSLHSRKEFRSGGSRGVILLICFLPPQSGRDRARCLSVRLPIPHAEPDWRLSPHPALPLWSISGNMPEASLPISSTYTVHSRWTACACAEYLWSGLPKGWGPSPSVLVLVCAALPRSDYYAPSDFPGRHRTFIRLSPSYFHRPSHPPWDLPCSHCRTQTRCCRWRVSGCPFRSLRLLSH
jgi:hypothetical protein